MSKKGIVLLLTFLSVVLLYSAVWADGSWTQQAELLADDGGDYDYFGLDVAMDEDTIVVGASRTELNTSGFAYMFTRNGADWSQQAKLTASDGLVNDYFGGAVDVDGDTVVIGASGPENSYGKAYIFTRNGSTWTQQAKLIPDDSASGDYFGWSVAVDGDTVVVGAIYKRVGTSSHAGSAYVFTRSGTTWTQQAKLVASDVASHDNFGVSVAVEQDTAVVGAINPYSGKESAYIYARSGTEWTQQTQLTSNTPNQFGRSVALFGDTIMVGAPYDLGRKGSVYVFTHSGTSWLQQAKLSAADGAAGDYLGWSVDISGNRAVAGAYDVGDYQGAAYTFTRSGTTWSQQDRLSADDGEAWDFFGYSTAIYGTTAVVGAFGDSSDTGFGRGAAYIFTPPTPPNQPPIADAGGPYNVLEGGLVPLDGSGSTDPDLADDVLTFEWDFDVDGDYDDATGANPNFSAVNLDGPTSVTVGLRVTDPGGLASSDTATISVSNVAPRVTISAPPAFSLIEAGTPVTFSGSFTDDGIPDVHTATWAFDSATIDDPINLPGVLTQGSGSGTISNETSFDTPGVYRVTLTVIDDDGGTGQAHLVDQGQEAWIVVYDPSGGFVSGGGWIESPSGAYVANPTLTGKATFGFVSKYDKKKETLTGNSEFHFKAASLNFDSVSYDWLVVAGHKAMFKGVGTINDSGNYGFMIMAVDEKLTPSRDVDLFRIKIWDRDSGDAVVYDNQLGDAEDADLSTEIGGGSIVIHKR